jgi:hypothetical protein
VIHRFTAKQAEEPQISQIRADFSLAAMPPDISLASAQVMKLDGLFFICAIREVCRSN